MSRLTDLIAQAKSKDPQLGNDLEREFKTLSSRLPFGLNFERHRPEVVELPLCPVRKGGKVRVLRERGSMVAGDKRLWQVKAIRGRGKTKVAELEMVYSQEPENQSVSIEDLVVVAEFRDVIYPGLVSTGKVERGSDKPYHTVINGENYHALRALTYTHRGKIDAIYIDPPYNSGAKDWKYNNDYVEADDSYRHSKWLAMMERRLLIAKELLKPADSALIVTIDEKEYLRLGLLLEQIFPECDVQMVTSVISPFGVARQNELSRVEEYIFYVRFGSASLGAPNDIRALLARDGQESGADSVSTETFWFSFMRAGSNSTRNHSPGCHYPIYADSQGNFHSVGEPLPRDLDRNDISPPDGCEALWPIKTNGGDGVWQASVSTARELFQKGYARIGKYSNKLGRRSVVYLRSGTIERIESEKLEFSEDGEIKVLEEATNSGRTVWAFSSHNATSHGTKLLAKILPDRKFPYPKSLFAVEDALRVCVRDKPNAMILDFFSGSGTTAHAVMRLNRQDGGNRQCISVTNNEVAADEQKALREKGFRPGDSDWEQFGICDFITKPRVKAAITGQTPDGEPVKGDYKFTDEFPMAEGFEENAEFFTLTYETPIAVNYNYAFSRIAPLLWMRAGSRGQRIDAIPDKGWAVVDAYGLLVELDRASAFIKALSKIEGLGLAYIVTDDDRRFQAIAKRLPDGVEPVRLYESYLSNFSFTNED